MRALAIVLLVIAAPAVVRAENVVEFTAGVTIPVGDSDWTKLVDASPILGVAAGAYGASGVGGLLRFDYTPVSLDNSGGSFGLGSSDISGQRYRILADVAFQHRVAPKISFAGRAGAGIDIAHASATVTVLGTTTKSSDTNVSYAFELAGGIWFDLGGVQLGGQLALPISSHDKQGNGSDGNYQFLYTSVDLDFTVGVRLVSR
jgi:hypothetical protein